MKLKIVFKLLLLLLIISNVAFASKEISSSDLKIAKGTEIHVKSIDTISSRNSKKNQKVYFKLSEDILCQDKIIIPSDTQVEATITNVKKSGSWGKNGDIELVFSEVKTKQGDSIPVNGMKSKGKNANFFIKYSLFGVLIKGQDVKIEKGTEVTLKVKEDVFF